jgi:predicted DNA-binding protein (MmcQ/YjbR family)
VEELPRSPAREDSTCTATATPLVVLLAVAQCTRTVTEPQQHSDILDRTRLHESIHHAGDGATCRASSRRLRDRADVADGPGRYDQPVTKDELLAHCLSKPGAWQDEPWEGDTVVKVGPKIFAFLGSGDGAATHGSVGVKCAANRDAADEWLKLYPDDASVMAYIGRSGWNTLRFGGAIPDDEVLDAVDESYRMIVAKLPKKDRPA